MIQERRVIGYIILKSIFQVDFYTPSSSALTMIGKAYWNLIENSRTDVNPLNWVNMEIIIHSEFTVMLKPRTLNVVRDDYWIGLNKLARRFLNIVLVPGEYSVNGMNIKFINKFKYEIEQNKVPEVEIY